MDVDETEPMDGQAVERMLQRAAAVGMTVYAVFMRPANPDDGAPMVYGIMEPSELSASMALRLRLNPDIRGRFIRFPSGTRREQVEEAINGLSTAERCALYARMVN